MATRSNSPEDKQKKMQKILDAADQLWQQQPNTIASVAELAKTAGIAKGTIYLYFNSKEEIFLALHERHITTFFSRLRQFAETTNSISIEDVMRLFRNFIGDYPTFPPIASLTQGLLERQIPLDEGIEFQARISSQMEDLVRILQRHFPGLTLMLMVQSYGLILGLWQLLRPSALRKLVSERDLYIAEVIDSDYLDVLENALVNIWSKAQSPENNS